MSATATQGQAERAELEAVLNSGIFSRSPILATFLKYICERYFAGDTEGLKEYCIAIEALKRPADFDQKKDAIVRVEAHRLRKRLGEYYQKEGAGHAIHIEIPNGQYAPRFVYKQADDAGAEKSAGSEVVTPEPLQTEAVRLEEEAQYQANTERWSAKPAGPGRAWIWWAGGLGAACLAAATFLWIGSSSPSKKDLASSSAASVSKASAHSDKEVWSGDWAAPVAADFRMLCGYRGGPFLDRQGRTWLPDAYYKGGVSVRIPDSTGIEGLPDPGFAPTQRTGDFEYAIPVNPGTYELHLHFIETQGGGVDGNGPVLFNVYVNGKLTLDHVDPLSDAGAPRRLTSRVLTGIKAAPDGLIHLKFEHQLTKPELVALEILASTSEKIRAIRIVTAGHSVTDVEGSVWMADEFAVGGTLTERKDEVPDSGLKSIYAGERYGNFAYHIAVPPGTYRIKLYFAETYFDNKMALGGASNGIGARVFNVFVEGQTLLRNFDVTKEAGGPHKAVIKTFEGLKPNAQGKIVIQFEPVRNYAEINAIEVTPM